MTAARRTHSPTRGRAVTVPASPPPAALAEEMRRRWRQLLAPFAPPSDAAETTWRELAVTYTHLDRHYHNLAHVRHVLDVLEAFRSPDHNAIALDLAAWFHDAVYDPRAAGNEER